MVCLSFLSILFFLAHLVHSSPIVYFCMFLGAIAVWYDLESSGHLEQKSSHGGCPILIGSKWIFNKWIYSFNQWKTYPCKGYKTYIEPFEGKYKNS